MTMNEIIQELLKYPEYFTESVEQILVGVRQRRTNRKARINKKWRKRYGVEPIYEEKKCKKLDVTIPLIIEFCRDHNLPLPDEFLHDG